MAGQLISSQSTRDDAHIQGDPIHWKTNPNGGYRYKWFVSYSYSLTHGLSWCRKQDIAAWLILVLGDVNQGSGA